jgi:hypothetical protein
MNCNNFEAIISDLAREQMLEAHTRESALKHVEECAACAKLLSDERALTRGLRSLAATMQHMEAPASVEANLLAKFRERTAAAIVEQSAPVVVEMPQRSSRWQRWYPQAVAAAVILMFAIGGASVLRLRQGQPTASDTNKVVAVNSNKTESQPSPASSAVTIPSSDEVNTPTEQADNTDRGGETGRKLSKAEVAALMGAPAPRRNSSYQSVPSSRVNRSGMTQAEIATEFLPVSYGDNLNEIENGRIVRVEMPRSALAQFGIPVNMDRANERIKADVLIGDDGMARAIRFVK